MDVTRALLSSLTIVALSTSVAGATISCNAGGACLVDRNVGSGPGLLGRSSQADGVLGEGRQGHPGVFASNTNADGIVGTAVRGSGVSATSASWYGAVGITASAHAAAVFAESADASAPAVAVSGAAPEGTGVTARGLVALDGTGTASCPATGCNGGTGTSYEPIAALGLEVSGNQSPFVLRNAAGAIVFSIDNVGTVFFAGKLICPNAAMSVYNTALKYGFTVCVAAADESPLARTLAGEARARRAHTARPAFAPTALASDIARPDTSAADTSADSCSATSACIIAANSGAGPGLEGRAAHNYGVEGRSSGPNGAGVRGIAAGGAGAYGASVDGYGIRAASVSGSAVEAVTRSESAAGVLALSTAPTGGIGLYALSLSGAATFGSGLRSFTGSGEVIVQGVNGAPLMAIANPRAGGDIFSVDDFDTPAFSGVLDCPAAYDARAGTCDAVATSDTDARQHVIRYGDARLTHGGSTVALDASTARLLSSENGYSVAITPEGDSAGPLYVAARTRRSFTVRERGGRSSIAFAYEITAEK